MRYPASRAYDPLELFAYLGGPPLSALPGPDFRVVTVLQDSPAAAAGINVGDLITEVDGRPATSVGQAEFGDLMRRPDGTAVRLSVVRDGRPRSVALTLEELLR